MVKASTDYPWALQLSWLVPLTLSTSLSTVLHQSVLSYSCECGVCFLPGRLCGGEVPAVPSLRTPTALHGEPPFEGLPHRGHQWPSLTASKATITNRRTLIRTSEIKTRSHSFCPLQHAGAKRKLRVFRASQVTQSEHLSHCPGAKQIEKLY